MVCVCVCVCALPYISMHVLSLYALINGFIMCQHVYKEIRGRTYKATCRAGSTHARCALGAPTQ